MERVQNQVDVMQAMKEKYRQTEAQYNLSLTTNQQLERDKLLLAWQDEKEHALDSAAKWGELRSDMPKEERFYENELSQWKEDLNRLDLALDEKEHEAAGLRSRCGCLEQSNEDLIAAVQDTVSVSENKVETAVAELRNLAQELQRQNAFMQEEMGKMEGCMHEVEQDNPFLFQLNLSFPAGPPTLASHLCCGKGRRVCRLICVSAMSHMCTVL
jgi:chromosome segregation ATPase